MHLPLSLDLVRWPLNGSYYTFLAFKIGMLRKFLKFKHSVKNDKDFKSQLSTQ